VTRQHRLLMAVVIAFGVAGSVLVIHQSSLARRSADFTIDYAAALLIREGRPQAIYQRDQLGPLMFELSNHAIDSRLPFDAPLALALPYVPLTLLDLQTAFRVWQLTTLVLLGLAIVLLARWVPLGARAPAVAALALLGFPSTWALLSEGQPSALLLLGAVFSIGAWQRGSWRLAAAGSCLLALKPQFLPVYLMLFIVRRQWRPLAAALVATLAVALSPLLAGGIQGYRSMVWSALDSGQGVIRYNESLIGSVGPFLPGRWPTIAAFSLWAFALGGLLVIALRGAGSKPAAALAIPVLAAGLLFAPHALPYDSMLLVVPAWLAFDLHRRGEIPTPVPAVFAMAAAMLIDLAGFAITLAPLVLLGSLVGYARVYRLRQQAQQQPAPPTSERAA
jgi:glycosyl transferase family 87